jgi:hypothetical protein
MTLKEKRELLKEIAIFAENSYRRGLQQGIAMGVNEGLAAEMRSGTRKFLLTVVEDRHGKLKLKRAPLLERLKIESKGPQLRALLYEAWPR